MLSDVDSVIRFREGQMQKLVRRTRSAFQREIAETQRETVQSRGGVMQFLKELITQE